MFKFLKRRKRKVIDKSRYRSKTIISKEDIVEDKLVDVSKNIKSSNIDILNCQDYREIYMNYGENWVCHFNIKNKSIKIFKISETNIGMSRNINHHIIKCLVRLNYTDDLDTFKISGSLSVANEIGSMKSFNLGKEALKNIKEKAYSIYCEGIDKYNNIVIKECEEDLKNLCGVMGKSYNRKKKIENLLNG